MNCDCGGELIFEHQNDGQHMRGYVYSYKCDKCQMLHLQRENTELRKALNVVCEDRDYLYGQVMKLSPKTDENNQTTN